MIIVAKPFKVGDIVRGVKLLELDELRSTKKEKYWKYECPECGAIKSARSSKVGTVCKSCASKENRSKRISSCVIDDLTGKEFGYWKVISKADKSNFWHCKCKICGTERDVFRGSLTSGDSKSCGCIKSWGETQLVYLLEQENMSYKREVTFPDLLGTKGGKLRFDFGIYQEDVLLCLIEYDGRQHFTYDKNWNQTAEEFNQLQVHDKIKDEYCKEHNIPLYRLNSDSNLEFFITNLVNSTKGGA